MKVKIELDPIIVVYDENEKYLKINYRFIKNSVIIFEPADHKIVNLTADSDFEVVNNYKTFIENIVAADSSIYYFLLALYNTFCVHENSYIEIMRNDNKLCYFNFENRSITFGGLSHTSGEISPNSGFMEYSDDYFMVMTFGVKNIEFTEPKISIPYKNSYLNPIEKYWSL